ncbi:3-hydroxyacyl-CoA dehydrogenase family protein [Conexibacter sp. DBS9H8]|uniref:3-hydroxyacyl-CoA dehydrogenase family protein n=1 Tax=Conexibacter sp. DBS9H8 TaxID=2937801 RepID=UPI00200E41EF|nr:3-hydroxyacyl-CoA dehydrogenase family protein [Conexibacter sp. DBS9H8]
MTETLGIAGSGTIASGLAVVASAGTDVVLWARSEESQERVRAAIAKGASRHEGADPGRITVTTELADLDACSFLVEAIVEDHASKAALLADLAELTMHQNETAILSTTTSSLSVSELAEASGHPERFVGLHVFNPVPVMKLVEVVFAPATSEETRARTLALCEQLAKVAVITPDTPGFVVNRLLFPYLFDAANFMAESGLEAAAIDEAMKLGAGVPMGPLALLDYVGLDVSKAIGDSLSLETPAPMAALIAEGALGKKAGRGFYDYS